MFVVLCMCSWEMVAVFVALFVFEITILLIYWCMVSTVFESCMGCFFFRYLLFIHPSHMLFYIYIYVLISAVEFGGAAAEGVQWLQLLPNVEKQLSVVACRQLLTGRLSLPLEPQRIPDACGRQLGLQVSDGLCLLSLKRPSLPFQGCSVQLAFLTTSLDINTSMVSRCLILVFFFYCYSFICYYI